MQSIVNYLYEAEQLKLLMRNWSKACVADRESIASHVGIAVQVGFFLAEMEGADSARVVCMLAFHEAGESRIGDIDYTGKKYLDKDCAEHAVVADQTSSLPSAIGQKICEWYDEMESRSTREGNIAKDADYLELAFQARVYQIGGNTLMDTWLENIGSTFRTESAKKLFKLLRETSPYEWCRELNTPPKK